jgi:hypothetical protein
MPDDAPRRVNVPTSRLKVGDVLETSVRHYVVTHTYKNEYGKAVVDVLGEDGISTSFSDAPTATLEGVHLRIDTGCEPTLGGLKEFLESLEAE